MRIKVAPFRSATKQREKGRPAMIAMKDLTPKFRSVRLLLAREKGHPGGEREQGYDFLVPLDDSGHLDREPNGEHDVRRTHGLPPAMRGC